ncbi:hypothetical protein Bca4012_055414 [Brassica carinata]
MILPMKLLHPLFSFTTLPSKTRQSKPYRCSRVIRSEIVVSPAPVSYEGRRVLLGCLLSAGSEILLTDSAEAVSTSRRALRASKIADSEFTSLPNGLKSHSYIVGGQRLVIVPPELAYGKKGVQEIPPNATVELDIELLSIKQSPFGTPVKIVEG